MDNKNSILVPQPPVWARRFLYWYCNDELAEEIDGDLMETFRDNLKLKGPRVARIIYILEVFRFIRPFTLSREYQYSSNHIAMFRNHLIVAYRSLTKKIGFSIINIFGLSVGITCCLLIMMFVLYETSYDSFQKNGDNIYRMSLDRTYPDRKMGYAVIPHSYPPQMVEDFPEVLKYTNFFSSSGGFSVTYRYGDKVFDEGHVIFADSNFFELVTVELISGDLSDALNGPKSIVLTESTARKFFGDEDPIGKSLNTSAFGTNDQESWMVMAVVKDYPENSFLRFGVVASSHTLQFLQNSNWMAFTVTALIQLQDGTRPEVVEAKIPEMIKKYAAGQIQQATGQSYDEYIEAGHGYHYYLTGIKDIHLSSNLQAEIKPNSSWNFIYMLVSIAMFILVIACINFMNLSTARSDERAKEVGLRKVMGSLKKFLIYQFLTESILLSSLSTILSIILVLVLLPYFNNLTGVILIPEMFLTPLNILAVILIALVIGVLAGFYPAFVLSSFKPASVLKGRLQASVKGKILRNGLVIFQFVISIALISATFIIYDQMSFIANKALGFDTRGLLVLDNTGTLNDRGELFRQQLAEKDEIVSASFSGSLPGDIHPGFVAQVPGVRETPVIQVVVADEYFLETLDIPLLSGRNFGRKFNDSLTMMLNETAVKVMGFDNPLGKRVGNQNPNNPDEIIYYTVVGVVADYHFESLHKSINPLVFLHTSSAPGLQFGLPNKIIAKINDGNFAQVVSVVDDHWKNFKPDSPFNYYFLDSRLEEFYQAEKTSGQVFTVFTALAILIACVGLFGLAAYTAGLKTKEIGVRKVLGASVWGIVILLSRDFTRLILIAVVVAVPLTYFGMDRWLEEFAYRINISPMSFILSGVVAVFIGWMTVSFQSFKAAIVNPVKSLRTE